MKHGGFSADQADALVNRIGGMDGVRKVLTGEWIVGEPANVLERAAGTPGRIIADLLEARDETVEVSAAEHFVARDRFVVDLDGELPISHLGDDFVRHVLGVVEEGAGTAKLREYTLLKSSTDGPIFSALGGEEAARVALAHAFEFLKGADRSKWFFFYVADAEGALWAMDTYWRDRGWDVEVYSITYPRGWRGGGRVVSCCVPV